MEVPPTQPRQFAHIKREESVRASENLSSSRIAHTLTACVRCRTRKTRCDPGLPRCGPCERTNSHCEYFDPAKGTKIPRNYVVHLQNKVRDLERQLADLEKDEQEPDAEDVMRGAAAVRLQESDESKFLGPSSGIAITRLVMQLAKQFTDAKSITEIVPDARARSIRERFMQEEAKPTSKIYPLISDVAAEDLPNRGLTDLLVQLFYSKVHPMYPIFHEPTFTQIVDGVYQGSTDRYQNFALRMVIAISLQRMDTQYAGLADSYYLAALKHLEAAVRPMDLRTLQCFALIACYSLLTPTRTAVYYVIGLAVRLVQALGLNEEKTITRGRNRKSASPLEIDMRRRIFWIILVMEFGLSHSLGRPSILATGQDHIDVGFFEAVDDEYITPDGIKPAPTSLKKWIAIHFYKMRLLQLEIRRKLYQKKRPGPKDDDDPWFHQMEAKLVAWRDTAPDMDSESGLNKVWFIGRYNTMIVFLFRPSPQVPRPSVRAAIQCYDACKYNIYMQRTQIDTRSVELTWIFTQSLFMDINTMLWTLSYSEVRRLHPREEVEQHLEVVLEAIALASERWPGVLSALELYQNLIDAIMKIYDKDGDFPISASSPSDGSTTSPGFLDVSSRSRTTSPATVSTQSVKTPPDRVQPPFGYILPQHYSHPPHPSATSLQATSPTPALPSPSQESPLAAPAHVAGDPASYVQQGFQTSTYDPNTQFNPLPDTFSDLVQWNPSFNIPQGSASFGMPATSPLNGPAIADPSGFPMAPNGVPYTDYLYPQSWALERAGMGLNQAQQVELMRSLEADGTDQIESMIQESNALFRPNMRTY